MTDGDIVAIVIDNPDGNSCTITRNTNNLKFINNWKFIDRKAARLMYQLDLGMHYKQISEMPILEIEVK